MKGEMANTYLQNDKYTTQNKCYCLYPLLDEHACTEPTDSAESQLIGIYGRLRKGRETIVGATN